MDTINCVSISFDKTQIKDLLMLQMITSMKENWDCNGVIDLFFESHYKFHDDAFTKAEIIQKIIETQKENLST